MSDEGGEDEHQEAEPLHVQRGPEGVDRGRQVILYPVSGHSDNTFSGSASAGRARRGSS